MHQSGVYPDIISPYIKMDSDAIIRLLDKESLTFASGALDSVSESKRDRINHLIEAAVRNLAENRIRTRIYNAERARDIALDAWDRANPYPRNVDTHSSWNKIPIQYRKYDVRPINPRRQWDLDNWSIRSTNVDTRRESMSEQNARIDRLYYWRQLTDARTNKQNVDNYKQARISFINSDAYRNARGSYTREYNNIFDQLAYDILEVLDEPEMEVLRLTVDDFRDAVRNTIESTPAGSEATYWYEHRPGEPNDIYEAMSPILVRELAPIIRQVREGRRAFVLSYKPITINEDGSISVGDTTSTLLSIANLSRVLKSAEERQLSTLEFYVSDTHLMTDVIIKVIPITRMRRQGGYFPYYLNIKFLNDTAAYGFEDEGGYYLIDYLNRCNIFTPDDPKRLNQVSCLHKAIFESCGVHIVYAASANDSSDISSTQLEAIARDNNIVISLSDEKDTTKNVLYGESEDNTLPRAYICRYESHFFANLELPAKTFCVPKHHYTRGSGNPRYFKSAKSVVKFLLEHRDEYLVPVPMEEAARVIAYHIDNRLTEGDKITAHSIDLTISTESMRSKRRDNRELSDAIHDEHVGDVFYLEIDADFEASVNTDKHIAIACSAISEDSNGEVIRFTGKTCAKQFIDYCCRLIDKYDELMESCVSVEDFKDQYGKKQKRYWFQLNTLEEYPQWIIDRYGNKHNPMDHKAICMNNPIRFYYRVYFHNLGYDKAHLANEFDNIHSYLGSGRSCKGFTGMVKDRFIYFRDNYALVPESIANFPKMFGLPDVKKGVVPYEFFSPDCMEDNYPDHVNLSYDEWSDVLDLINPSKRNEFIEYTHNNGLVVDNGVNIVFYHKECMMDYCDSDVIIQRQGRMAYRELIVKGLNGVYTPRPHSDYTNSGMAQAIATAMGAYDGCCKLVGSVSEFIRRFCCPGGRCMLRNNTKQHVTGKLLYVDFNSLYPVAQMTIKGTPLGFPKMLGSIPPNKNLYEEIDRLACDDECSIFVRLRITNVPNKRPFPLLFREDKDGTRVYTDECSEDDPILFGVDRWAYNALREFYGLVPERDFTILDGCYFDQGRTNKLGIAMEKIYWLRKEYQKAKEDSVAAVLKLVLNSIWGKDMQRTYYENISVVPNDELMSKLSDERNTVYKYSDFNADGSLKLVKSSVKKIPESRAHVASEVLGCSKYLMIRFMDILDKLGVYYTYSDTDSVVMDANGYKAAREEFKNLYGFDIDGESDDYEADRKNPPGTLHPDFKPSDVLYATEFIGVGKKVYYMRCLRSNGEECEVYKFKGMSRPDKTIPYYCEQNGITVREFFIKLLNGEKISVPQVYKHSAPSFTMDPKTWQYKSNQDVLKEYKFEGEIVYVVLNDKAIKSVGLKPIDCTLYKRPVCKGCKRKAIVKDGKLYPGPCVCY